MLTIFAGTLSFTHDAREGVPELSFWHMYGSFIIHGTDYGSFVQWLLAYVATSGKHSYIPLLGLLIWSGLMVVVGVPVAYTYRAELRKHSVSIGVCLMCVVAFEFLRYSWTTMALPTLWMLAYTMYTNRTRVETARKTATKLFHVFFKQTEAEPAPKVSWDNTTVVEHQVEGSKAMTPFQRPPATVPALPAPEGSKAVTPFQWPSAVVPALPAPELSSPAVFRGSAYSITEGQAAMAAFKELYRLHKTAHPASMAMVPAHGGPIITEA